MHGWQTLQSYFLFGTDISLPMFWFFLYRFFALFSISVQRLSNLFFLFQADTLVECPIYFLSCKETLPWQRPDVGVI